MPKTPPTIVAPLPQDPRVMSLAKTVSLTRREAFAAAAEAWAWMSVMAVDDIVPQTAPDSLDSVVDIEGFGQAMFQAGLVGTVDGGLVLPAELCRRQRDERRERATTDAEDQERRRKDDRIRQRRSRAQKRLTKPTTSPALTANDNTLNKTPSRLGSVDGCSVMLLWSRKNVPFYALKGATPKEFTGTVSDQENPSFADALMALHAAMKRESGKGLGSGDTFRPSLQSMVTAAERYRQERQETAAAAARRAEGNKALAEASAVDHDDIEYEPAERDCHAPVTAVTRDTVTVTVLSRPESVTCPPKSSADGDLENVTCHAPVTEPAPSSSSSSVFLGNQDKEKTTTTSSVTPHDRDHEDGILDRMLGAGQAPQDEDPATAERRRKRQQMVERFAAALGATAEAVNVQWRAERHVLRARLESVGIDPTTGFPFNAEASSAPAQARDDIGVAAEPNADDKPAAGIVGARSADEPDDTLSQTAAAEEIEDDQDDAFERQRTNIVKELAAGV
jgi:hypothetical protein